jgi:hypothetical protein
MPPAQELSLGNVPDTAKNPWVFKIQVILIVANNHNIMPVIPVVFVVDSGIGPGLEQDDDGLLARNIVLEVLDCHVLLHGNGEAELLNGGE